MVDESGNHHEMVQVHELGFVKLLDVMGDDQEVENAARISYEKEQERYRKHGI